MLLLQAGQQQAATLTPVSAGAGARRSLGPLHLQQKGRCRPSPGQGFIRVDQAAAGLHCNSKRACSRGSRTAAGSGPQPTGSASSHKQQGQHGNPPEWVELPYTHSLVAAMLPFIQAAFALLGALGRAVDSLRQAVASLFPQLEGGISREVR